MQSELLKRRDLPQLNLSVKLHRVYRPYDPMRHTYSQFTHRQLAAVIVQPAWNGAPCNNLTPVPGSTCTTTEMKPVVNPA
ncbi:unnamed protein product [Arctia plantaginis]|uniref:Uncharacterized protein n=1 Tax=Arctia plantaginis TaxID=874455 RepID=A0A8S0ZMR8_ARCPL|nr:unnamed protein product [Arctia plantaginis]